MGKTRIYTQRRVAKGVYVRHSYSPAEYLLVQVISGLLALAFLVVKALVLAIAGLVSMIFNGVSRAVSSRSDKPAGHSSQTSLPNGIGVVAVAVTGLILLGVMAQMGRPRAVQSALIEPAPASAASLVVPPAVKMSRHRRASRIARSETSSSEPQASASDGPAIQESAAPAVPAPAVVRYKGYICGLAPRLLPLFRKRLGTCQDATGTDGQVIEFGTLRECDVAMRDRVGNPAGDPDESGLMFKGDAPGKKEYAQCRPSDGSMPTIEDLKRAGR